MSQQQFVTLKAILNELGIMVLESGDYEADDLIGSVASHFENPFMKIKILTKDHDYLQLKTDNIDVWIMQTSADTAERMRLSTTSEKLKNGSMWLQESHIQKMTVFHAKQLTSLMTSLKASMALTQR